MMGYELIPAELKQLKQWVCWQAVPDESRPGKMKKMPIKTPMTNLINWQKKKNNYP